MDEAIEVAYQTLRGLCKTAPTRGGFSYCWSLIVDEAIKVFR